MWLLSLTYAYFSIKFRITFYTWMKNILDLNLFLHLFVLFVNRKMKLLDTFFTLAIKQNLFSLDSKSYCTQKNFFHKIRHWMLSLFFSDNKHNFEIINHLHLIFKYHLFKSKDTRKMNLAGLKKTIINVLLITHNYFHPKQDIYFTLCQFSA